MSIIFQKEVCAGCEEFASYENATEKYPNNCHHWLCNNGTCPKDHEIFVVLKQEQEAAKSAGVLMRSTNTVVK